MTEIKSSNNIINVLDEIEEKTNNLKGNKSKSNEFLFFPVMDIQNKLKINNKFDRRHSRKFLEEKDKYLEVVEIDDKLPEEIEENSIYEISKIDPLNITFGI